MADPVKTEMRDGVSITHLDPGAAHHSMVTSVAPDILAERDKREGIQRHLIVHCSAELREIFLRAHKIDYVASDLATLDPSFEGIVAARQVDVAMMNRCGGPADGEGFTGQEPAPMAANTGDPGIDADPVPDAPQAPEVANQS